MRRTPAILGVHWDDGSISMAAVRRQQGKVSVLAWDRQFLESGVIVNGVIQNPRPVRRGLQTFIRNHHLKVEHLALSLPAQATRLTVMELSSEQYSQADQIIHEQLEHCTPFGRGHTLNAHVLYESEQGWRALNAMTPQTGSDAALELTTSCGVTLDRLSPMAWPILEGLQACVPPQEHSLLWILDQQAASLCVLQGHRMLFAQTLALTLDAVRQDQVTPQALSALVEPILNYAQSLQTGTLTLRLASSGSYEDLRAVTLKIRHALKHVQVKPLGAVQWSKPLSLTGEGLKHCPLPPLAAAWELARADRPGSGLHLVSPQTLQKLKANRQIGMTSQIAALLVVLIGLSTVPLHWKVQQIRADSGLWNEQMAQSHPLQEQFDRLSQQVKQTQQAIAMYQQAYQGLHPTDWSAILTDLVERLPQNTRLAEIWSTDKKQLMVTGQTLQEAKIHEFSQSLVTSSHIRHAVVDEVSADPQRTAVVDFRLTVTLGDIQEVQP